MTVVRTSRSFVDRYRPYPPPSAISRATVAVAADANADVRPMEICAEHAPDRVDLAPGSAPVADPDIRDAVMVEAGAGERRRRAYRFAKRDEATPRIVRAT